ncbi:MAG: FapA family protein [Lachnospiraceae bacterium]|nr:FapA family protein [Lachnospiraceae bacterium]
MAEISITFADNDMKAYLMLPEPEDDTFDYYSEEVFTEIKKKGISQGLDKETVMDMIQGHVYNTPVLIAEGTPVIDGIDGYFEYMFSQEESHKKPQILDDGTVDYSNINSVGTVSKNDLIATYHKAIPGHFGSTVKGVLLKPKGAREHQMPRLIGCRFDKKTNNFYSEEDGKVEVEPGKIVVKSTLEINKNVNQTYGNVFFIGDIIITGNVESGV